MNKFKEGDRVRIKGGTLAGKEYIIEYKSEEPFNCDEDQYHIKNNQKPFGFDMREGNLELIETVESEKSKLLFEQVMDGSYYNDESYMEMATIASQDGVSIKVNQEVKRLSIAYFKVFNHVKLSSADKVARLHFKDSGIEIHESDPSGKKIWIPNGSDIKNIRKLLCKQNGANKKYANWQYMCFEWNRENELVGDDIDVYFSGKYDHMYDSDSRLKEAYVPSTQRMPETWKSESK